MTVLSTHTGKPGLHCSDRYRPGFFTKDQFDNHFVVIVIVYLSASGKNFMNGAGAINLVHNGECNNNNETRTQ